MNALVIGRFQPVHNGHVALLKKVDSLRPEKIILGIGVNGGRTPRNPFSFKEVLEMWLPELKKLAAPVEVYEIPDINDSERYAAHVERITGCSENDTVVVSGNDSTLECFSDYSRKYATYAPYCRLAVGNECLCATIVRERMREGTEWQELVPESTRQAIARINGAEILRSLGEEYAKQLR